MEVLFEQLITFYTPILFSFLGAVICGLSFGISLYMLRWVVDAYVENHIGKKDENGLKKELYVKGDWAYEIFLAILCFCFFVIVIAPIFLFGCKMMLFPLLNS